MIIAEVIPIDSSHIAETLSYFSAQPMSPGTLVTIPLRKKEIYGIVLSVSDVKNFKQSLRHQSFTIRNITQIHNQNIFSSAYLNTIAKLKSYYLINSGAFISATYPKFILDNFEKFIPVMHQNHQEQDEGGPTSLIQKPLRERIKIYQKYIEDAQKEKKLLHIICPTILDVKNLEKELHAYTTKIFTFHSKLSKKKGEKTYRELLENTDGAVMISTPQFLDIPQQKRSVIIIEKDSSSYYYRTHKPEIDFRIFIEEYAQQSQIPLVFTDNILRTQRFAGKDLSLLEKNNTDVSFQIFSSRKISLISPQARVQKISDKERIQELSEKKHFSAFLRETKKHLERAIQEHKKIFLYTRRKSLAPTIICRDCGKLVQDRETHTPYSLFMYKDEQSGEKKLFYVNKFNGSIIPAFDTCQFCGSWRLQTLGVGTETLHKEVQELFPEIPSFIIDGEHLKTQRELKNTLKSYYADSTQAQILIGTQRALPYLHDIDVSFIVSLDGIFYMQSYSNEERALSLVKNIYDVSKKTFLQTRFRIKKEKINRDAQNQQDNTLSNELSIKFSKKIQSLVQNLRYTQEFTTAQTHHYAEDLLLWNVIKTGNLLSFLKKKKPIDKTVIVIEHEVKKGEYQKFYKYYHNQLRDYTPNISLQKSHKKNQLIIKIIIHVNYEQWNLEYQNTRLHNIIPFNSHSISIKINPEIF